MIRAKNVFCAAALAPAVEQLAAPDQVEVHPGAVDGLPAQVHGGDLEFVVQPQRPVGDRLHQRKAVEPEPQRFVEFQRTGVQAFDGLDALARCRHEIGTQQVL